KLNPIGVVLAGTLGSYLGSAVTYWASRFIGRPLVVKYGRFVLLSEKKLEQAEHWLARYEAGGVFFARLLPVVRHWISIPAGIVSTFEIGASDFATRPSLPSWRAAVRRQTVVRPKA